MPCPRPIQMRLPLPLSAAPRRVRRFSAVLISVIPMWPHLASAAKTSMNNSLAISPPASSLGRILYSRLRLKAASSYPGAPTPPFAAAVNFTRHDRLNQRQPVPDSGSLIPTLSTPRRPGRLSLPLTVELRAHRKRRAPRRWQRGRVNTQAFSLPLRTLEGACRGPARLALPRRCLSPYSPDNGYPMAAAQQSLGTHKPARHFPVKVGEGLLEEVHGPWRLEDKSPLVSARGGIEQRLICPALSSQTHFEHLHSLHSYLLPPKMFSRIAIVTMLAAPLLAVAQSCNTGSMQCCDSVASVSDSC